MKKIFCFLSILLSFFILSSCDRPKLEEVIPKEDDYASWDGNYLYFDNYRCKTDGSFEEQLIKEIVYEDKIYKVENCQDYVFINDDIYYLFLAYCTNEECYYTFFLKYSIKDKAVNVIYSERGSTFGAGITVSGNYLLVSTNFLIKYNVLTNDFKIKEETGVIMWGNKYILSTDNNSIYLTRWDSTSKEYVCEDINKYLYSLYNIITVDGHDILMIKRYDHLFDKNETIIDEIEFYDITGKKLIKFLDFSEEKCVISQYNEYLIVGERKYYGEKDPGYEEENNVINNVIYKLNYLDGELKWESKNLKSDKQYRILDIVDDVLKVEESYYYLNILVFYYFEESSICYYQFNSNKVSKETDKIFEETKYNEIRYGNIKYVVESIGLGGVLDGYDACFLYQIDEKQNKNLMQFFTTDDYGVNRCSLMFLQYYLDGNYLEEDLYKVLNY